MEQTIIKNTVVLAILTFLNLTSYSQNPSYFDLGLIRAFGLDWRSVNYTSLADNGERKLLYSAGGGTGIQLQYGKYLSESLAFEASSSFQQVLAYKYENINGTTNRSSASFNNKLVGVGLNYVIHKSGKMLEMVSVGGKMLYSWPGKLLLVENKETIVRDKFENTLGLQLQSTLIFDIFSSKRLKAHTVLAYRSLRYKNSGAQPLPKNDELDGRGLNLMLGMRKLL